MGIERRSRGIARIGIAAAVVGIIALPGWTAPPAAAVDSAATIVVSVGGDRVSDTVVGGLAGAELRLYATADAVEPAASCASDAAGTCTMAVPQELLGSTAWVRQISAPPGWEMNAALRTGPGSNSTSEESPYAFETPVLVDGTAYRSTREFMYSSSNSLSTRSNGVWQNSRANPALPEACGIDVALVFDLSASVGSALSGLKSAADALVDALAGTPSRMGLFSFSAQSPSEQTAGGVSENHPGLLPISTDAGAEEVKSWYADWSLGRGTNWDDALQTVTAADEAYDVAIVLTDGNPTRWGGDAGLHGDGGNTHLTDVEAAVFSANALKAEGTRVVSFGIGKGVEGITSLNLAAISGPVAFDGANAATADHFQIPEFSDAGDVLRAIATQQCAGSLTVVKQIVPEDRAGEDVSGAVPAGAGWEFAASGDDAGTAVSPGTAVTADDGTGSVTFAVDTGGAAGRVGIAETQQAGYQLVTQGGRNAVCRELGTDASVAVENSGGLGFDVPVNPGEAITCTMYNRALPVPVESSVRVDKTWVVDGESFAHGDQPSGIDAEALVTGPDGEPDPLEFGAERGGYTPGALVEVDETVQITRAGCTLEDARVTAAPGGAASGELPSSAELDAGLNVWALTNVVHCEATSAAGADASGAAADAGAEADASAGSGAGGAATGGSDARGADGAAGAAPGTGPLATTGGGPLPLVAAGILVLLGAAALAARSRRHATDIRPR
ncbi:VWA domain-containing protein [Leucobacter allii]|uniref:VWA domain-containing protein n=1 Tax=Leucobacter allii TaxID=2932247 RepID=A0ABY4FJB4_9MICO|nr:vWA domain-containing protein [Leucobacter allii]UOQ56191.1 VWA domain-containing protein [Leucobacter allii]